MSRVSLVMAVFNQLPLTRACLESLRPTTVTFDLVVVDNGSTDGTAEFLRAFPYPFPFRAHHNQGNLGLIRALNQGVGRAGRDVGRTIVHCLADGPGMREPEVEVAAVDGVCLFLRRSLLETLGGFDEGYGFFRLRPGPVVRGEGGGRPVRRRERPFHSPGRGHARLRRRGGAARRGSGAPARGGG